MIFPDEILPPAEDLATTIRQLRQDLNHGQAFLIPDELQLRYQFQTSIQIALTKVTQEWDLTKAIKQ